MMYRDLETQEDYERRHTQMKSSNAPDIINIENVSLQDRMRLFNSLLPGDIVYCGDEVYTYIPDYRYEDSMPFISQKDNMLCSLDLECITKVQFTHKYDLEYAEMFYHYSCFLRALIEPRGQQSIFSRMENIMSYAQNRDNHSAEGITVNDVYVAPYDCHRPCIEHDLEYARHAIYLGVYNIVDLENAFPSFREQYRVFLSSIGGDLLVKHNWPVFLLESGEFLVGCDWYHRIPFNIKNDDWVGADYLRYYLEICNAIVKSFKDYVDYIGDHPYEFPARNFIHSKSAFGDPLIGIGTEKFIIGFVDMSMYINKSNEKTSIFSE